MFFDWTYVVLVLPGGASGHVGQRQRKQHLPPLLHPVFPPGNYRGPGRPPGPDANGLTAVRIEHISGNLTDHYDPKANVIRLSDQVYDNTSTAAIGVALPRGRTCGASTPWATPPSGFAPPLSPLPTSAPGCLCR